LKRLATSASLTAGTRKKTATTWAQNHPLNIYVNDQPELERLLPIIRLATEAIDAGKTTHTIEMTAFEIDSNGSFPEGGRIAVTLNAYERSRTARNACVAYYGALCLACGFDFEKRYGLIGLGFIHVHHVVPIASIGSDYQVDPIKDLRPVCANCHEMLHRRSPPYSIDELKSRLVGGSVQPPAIDTALGSSRVRTV